jgi:hypothetical protein
MRKSWLFIIALVTLGFLAGAAGAATVQISGRHGMGEIASTCASVGGTFSSGLGGDYHCEGSCPSCGERRQRPRGPVPVLSGANAVEHVLKNSVKRPSKRY